MPKDSPNLSHNTYHGPMITSKATIEHEAREAVQQGKTANEACRYPFCSEQGAYFKLVFESELSNGRERTEHRE